MKDFDLTLPHKAPAHTASCYVEWDTLDAGTCSPTHNHNERWCEPEGCSGNTMAEFALSWRNICKVPICAHIKLYYLIKWNGNYWGIRAGSKHWCQILFEPVSWMVISREIFFLHPWNQKELSNLAFCSKISILDAHRALHLARIKGTMRRASGEGPSAQQPPEKGQSNSQSWK